MSYFVYNEPDYVYHRKRDGILRINNKDGTARFLTLWESIKHRVYKFLSCS